MKMKFLITGSGRLINGEIDPDETAVKSTIWILFKLRHVLEYNFICDREFMKALGGLSLQGEDYHSEMLAAYDWAREEFEYNTGTPLDQFTAQIHLNQSYRSATVKRAPMLILRHDNLISQLLRYMSNILKRETTMLLKPFVEFTNQQTDKFQNAAIYLTGPSLDLIKPTEIRKREFDLEIFANSAIKRVDLLQDRSQMKGNAQRVIVASDPIFHCGYSSYVEEFYAHLENALALDNTILVVPERDVLFYLSCIRKEYHEKVYYLGFGPEISCIKEVRSVAPFSDLTPCSANKNLMTSNVLTGFALPVAAALSENVAIFGCDGRPVEENEYYWGHAKSGQLQDKMQAIRRLHSDFFPDEYDSYYRKHILQTRIALFFYEKFCRISVESHSYIPPLFARHIFQNSQTRDLSIVIPCFNLGEKIYRTLNSIALTEVNYEIVLVDDGSCEESARILVDISESRPHVRLITQKNRGVSAARNTGLKASQGEYVLFFDGGDIVHSEQMQMMFLEAKSEKLAAISGLVRQVHKGLEVGISRKTDSDFWAVCDLAGGYPINTLGTILHRYVAAEVLFQENMENAEDKKYYWEVIKRGIAIKHYRYVVADYIIEGGSATTSLPSRHALSVVSFLRDECEASDSAIFLRPFSDDEIKQLQKTCAVSLQSLIFYILVCQDKQISFPSDFDLSAIKKVGVGEILTKRFVVWGRRANVLVATERQLAQRVADVFELALVHKIDVSKFVASVADWWREKKINSIPLGLGRAVRLKSKASYLHLTFNGDSTDFEDKEYCPGILFYSPSIKLFVKGQTIEVLTNQDGKAMRSTVILLNSNSLELKMNLGASILTLNDTEFRCDPMQWSDLVIGGGYLKRYYGSAIYCHDVDGKLGDEAFQDI